MKKITEQVLVISGILVALAIAIVALAFAVTGHRSSRLFNSLDITGAAYADDFDLLDPDGHRRTLASFRGKVVLVFFGFTQCPAACPTELARSAQVLHLLGPDAARVQMVFVTIDPERDTPPVLRDYVHAFDPTFLGLYGDLPTTARTAHRFRAYYTKVPTGSSYTMDHTALTYAFDPSGQVRLIVRPEEGADSVAADVRQLLAPHA